MAMIRSALISYLLSLFCLFVFSSVASLHPDHHATYGASALSYHSYASGVYHDSNKAGQLTSDQASEIPFFGAERVLSHNSPIPLDADEENDPNADDRMPKQEVGVTPSSSRRTLSQEVGNPATLSAGEAQDGKANNTVKDGKHDRASTRTEQTNQTPGPEHQPAPAVAPKVNPARSNKTETKERKDASEGPANKDETRKKTNSSTEPMQQCDDSYCEVPSKVVTACLQMLGDGTHKFSLSIRNRGGKDVDLTVNTPMFLKAEQAKLLVKHQTSETVLIDLTDKTALDSDKAKNMNITVSSIHGDCSIRVPVVEDFQGTSSLKYSQYFVYLTPKVAVYILLGLLSTVCGVILFCKYRRKKRAGGSVKYQQLEMNTIVVGTPKEREEETVDGWDEMWDEDWEDTEAIRSSSRLTQNLSSRGLAARRGNKDGWDD